MMQEFLKIKDPRHILLSYYQINLYLNFNLWKIIRKETTYSTKDSIKDSLL